MHKSFLPLCPSEATSSYDTFAGAHVTPGRLPAGTLQYMSPNADPLLFYLDVGAFPFLASKSLLPSVHRHSAFICVLMVCTLH
jgi:hypothetical protein